MAALATNIELVTDAPNRAQIPVCVSKFTHSPPPCEKIIRFVLRVLKYNQSIGPFILSKRSLDLRVL